MDLLDIHSVEIKEFFACHFKRFCSHKTAFFDLAFPDHRDDEKHADACFQCGQKQSDVAKAREYYQKALKINPAHAGAREALGLEPVKETEIGKTQKANEDEVLKSDQKSYSVSDLEKAKERWKLPTPYTQYLVKLRYPELSEEQKFPQALLDNDYVLLLKHGNS